MPWILDTDPGVDDAAAIVGAVHLPWELLGITVVHGNAALDQTVTNALRMVELLEANVPVYAGAPKPLLGPACHALEIHGQDGMGDVVWPPLSIEAEGQHAVQFLIESARQHPGDLNLLAVGPLTNIALAAAMDPSFVDNVDRVVIMGGTYQGQGNTSMVGEFNFFADPEAAAIVLQAGWHVEIVPWETTLRSLVPIDVLPSPGFNPVADQFRDLSAHLVHRMQKRRGVAGLLMCDFAALGVAWNPGLAAKTEEVFGEVETSGRFTRGMLALDYGRVTGRSPNITMVEELDESGLQRLFADVFHGPVLP